MQKTEKSVNQIMFELVCFQKKHKLGLFHQQSAQEMQYYVLGVN